MLENSNTGVGGAEVDTNSTLLCHFVKLFKANLKFRNVENTVAMYFIMQVPQCLLVQELWSQFEENKSI